MKNEVSQEDQQLSQVEKAIDVRMRANMMGKMKKMKKWMKMMKMKQMNEEKEKITMEEEEERKRQDDEIEDDHEMFALCEKFH